MCKQVKVSVEIPRSSLPLPLRICHCNMCRYTNGQLAHTVVLIYQSPQRNIAISGKPVQFIFNDEAQLVRNFCGTCGTTLHGFMKWRPSSIGGFASGSLDIDPAMLKYDGNVYIDDTVDGGIVPWLPEGSNWNIDDGGSQYKPDLNPFEEPKPRDELLHCSCQCGGVQFQITRPDATSTSFWAPYCEPYAAVRGCTTTENPNDEKYWISKDGLKYLACICTCHSCRLASGAELPSWAFVPPGNILTMDGSPYTFSGGTLTTYESSPGVKRDFCGKCGATAFFRWIHKPNLIDVSPGLMRSKTGVRAEDWLFWATSRISYPQDARHHELAENVQKGIREWATKAGRELIP